MMAWLLFHGLDISALLVLAGIALSLWRRMTDKGARTLQQFGMDFLPDHHAVRDLGHRPGADGFAGVAARFGVQFSGDSARRSR